MIRTNLVMLLMTICIFSSSNVWTQESSDQAQISDETEQCIDCHQVYTPGIVADWKASLHARVSPKEGLIREELSRRISSEAIPEELLGNAVGCYECHGLNTEDHSDAFDHFDLTINVVVSPTDCGICHAVEVEQYSDSKKAHAHGNLVKNPVYGLLMDTILGVKSMGGGGLEAVAASDEAKGTTCLACHGTDVRVTGMRLVDSDLGEIQVPELSGWPNMGVGRLNPDGSRGSCTACHPRHGFSIEMARKPETCSQCHLEPDVPAWNVYRESKHGNIYQALGDGWTWDSVPWTVGQDFTAPTCAVCHNSLVVDTEGEIIAERSHDFGSRLWVRLFGLIYSHAQPKTGETHVISNADELPLPTTFAGEEAADFLIDAAEQVARKEGMAGICGSCHGSQWAAGHFSRLDVAIDEADRMVKAATNILTGAWDAGHAQGEHPFDESLEHQWMEQWLFYANSVRYAAAMGGPDYAAFKNGWWYLMKNLASMDGG